jgi:hypothetical protein
VGITAGEHALDDVALPGSKIVEPEVLTERLAELVSIVPDCAHSRCRLACISHQTRPGVKQNV